MADRMAAEVTPEQQSLQAEALKDLEARQQEMQKSDPAAAQQMADRLKEARDQDAAMRADPKGYFRQSFMAGLQTLEKVRLRLEPGGKVVVEGAESGGEGDNGEGTWKLDGDKIEIAAAMPDEEGQGQPERMTGTFTGDRMELRPVETPPDEAAPGEEGSDDSAADEDKDSAKPRKATRRRTRRRRSPSRSCPGCWCAPTTSTTAEVHGSLFDAASGSGGRAAGGGGASATSRGRPRGRAGAPRAGPRAAGAPPARSAAAAPRPGRAAPLPPTAAARTTAR